MDILLATPINKTHYCVPSLGLGYLVSALTKAGFSSVSLLDPVRERMDYNRLAVYLRQNSPSILGIQCFSFDVPSVERMLKIAKDIRRSIVTIIGGPHPTAVSNAIFEDLNNLDFAMQGEGEISLPLFANALLNGKGEIKNIPGLVFKDNGIARANPPEVINDLDSLDMPAWNMMNPRTYPDEVQGGFYRNFPVAPIITSRGCPYDCTFCANKISMGRRLRQRNIDKVVEEIEFLLHNYGVREIQILDDNFTLNKRRVLDFCRKIKEKNVVASFSFPNGVRIDSLDEEVLNALKNIGAYSITVGVESGSQKILDHMKKNLTLDLIRDKMHLIKKTGFIVNAFFIVGYPAEDRADIMATIRFARELPIDVAHFSSFLPLPGTEITHDLLRSGKLQKINYGELFYSKTPFSPEGITKEELKRLQRKAFLSFYISRPHILLRLILRIRSFRHLKSIFRRAVDYILKKGKTKNE